LLNSVLSLEQRRFFVSCKKKRREGNFVAAFSSDLNNARRQQLPKPIFQMVDLRYRTVKSYLKEYRETG
jgi:hypothetical protein